MILNWPAIQFSAWPGAKKSYDGSPQMILHLHLHLHLEQHPTQCTVKCHEIQSIERYLEINTWHKPPSLYIECRVGRLQEITPSETSHRFLLSKREQGHNYLVLSTYFWTTQFLHQNVRRRPLQSILWFCVACWELLLSNSCAVGIEFMRVSLTVQKNKFRISREEVLRQTKHLWNGKQRDAKPDKIQRTEASTAPVGLNSSLEENLPWSSLLNSACKH